MRLYVLTQEFIPPFFGGSAFYYYHILAHLAGCDVTVFAPPIEGARATDSNRPYATVRPWYLPFSGPKQPTKLRKMLMLVCMPFHVGWWCLRRRPDVLVAAQPYFVGLVTLLISRLFRIPYVVVMHSEELTIAQGASVGLQNMVIRSAAHAITSCSATAEYIRDKRGRSGPIAAVLPGVEVPEPVEQARLEALRDNLSISSDEKVLLFFGRLIERKGGHLVIEALPEIIRRIGPCKFIIAGGGPARARLERLTSDLHLGEHVIFAGHLKSEDVPQYFALCHCFVLANFALNLASGGVDLEGFGITLLEAQAAGRPVVAGIAGGSSDSVADGETGLLVDPTDREQLVSAIVRILGDEDYARRLGERGRRRAQAEFSWAEKARQFCSVLESAARGK